MNTAAGPAKFAANGSFADNLAFADRDKERTFIDSITSGQSHNQIAAGVETALSCMLGRMAGYRKTRSDLGRAARPRRNLQTWDEPEPIRLSGALSGAAWQQIRLRSDGSTVGPSAHPRG